MRHLLLPLLVCLQTTYIYPTIVTEPSRCFMWNTTCVTALAQNISPGYIQKIPDLGCANLDPLPIDYLRVDKDDFFGELIDLKVYGLKNLTVDELSFYSNISVGHLLFHTDLFFTGSYKINGSLFFNPVHGEGDLRVSFKNLEIELFIPYDTVKNASGEDFMEASNYKFRYDFKESAQFHLDNLYNGNTELSESMHYLLNSNWKFIVSEYGRSFVSKLVDSIGKVYKNYFRFAKVFGGILKIVPL